MMNLLRSSVNVIAQAAQDVADELQHQATQTGGNHSLTGAKEPEGELVCLGPDNRVVLCGFPEKAQADEVYREDRSLRPFSDPTVLKKGLEAKFGETELSFLVWNLSGKKYSYDELDGKIIEYDFPSRPILPFNVLVEVVNAIKSWIGESPRNVAVVHDISGRRAAVVVACVLEALEYYPKTKALRAVANEMGNAGNALVASQIRYYEYYCTAHSQSININHDKELKIERMIVNGIPDFTFEKKLSPSEKEASCRPFVRIIDCHGLEIDATVPPEHPIPREETSFNLVPTIPLLVTKDIVLKFYHHKENGHEQAMFGIAFHVGFVNDIIMRFSAPEIDGTLKNPRFLQDMFVDIIFSEPESHPAVYVDEPDNEIDERVTAAMQAVSLERDHMTTGWDKSLASDTNLTANSKSLSPIQLKLMQSPSSSDKADNVLKEIEAALGDEDFADEDFELSELDDIKSTI